MSARNFEEDREQMEQTLLQESEVPQVVWTQNQES